MAAPSKRALAAAHATGRKAWADVELSQAHFSAFLSERASNDTELAKLDLASLSTSPELEMLKKGSAEKFRDLVSQAIAALPEELRGYLRRYYLEHFTLEELAALFRVSIATASRRLAAAREEVARRTRQALQ